MPRKTPLTFGQILKAEREKAELTGRALAAKAGIMFTAVYKLERDETAPTWDTVQRLARALDLPTDHFRTL